MTKSVVTRLFVGGIVAFVAGVVLVIVAAAIAWTSGVIVTDGTAVTGIHATPQAWAFIVLALLGVVSVIGGSIAGLVAWIGALLNTADLDDKSWFVLLLVLGLLSFGFVAMLAYVIAGPDSTLLRRTDPRAHQPV